LLEAGVIRIAATGEPARRTDVVARLRLHAPVQFPLGALQVRNGRQHLGVGAIEGLFAAALLGLEFAQADRVGGSLLRGPGGLLRILWGKVVPLDPDRVAGWLVRVLDAAVRADRFI